MKSKIRVELACAAFAVLAAVPAIAASSPSDKTLSAHAFSAMPEAVQSGISETLGRDDARYRATASNGGFHISNPSQQMSVEFTPTRASIAQGAANWQMSLLSYGYGTKLGKAGIASLEAHDNRVDYHRGSMTEWYVNGPLGMEQGFTLNSRPGVSNHAPLTLEIGLSGNVTPSMNPVSHTLTLASNGEAALRYSGLTAYDSKGTALKSWMEVDGSNLLLHVEDGAAQYPITVDPYVQKAILTSSDSAGGDNFGYSVAINNDYAVIGAPDANTTTGAVYVFSKPTKSTSKFTAKLTASNGLPGDGFGTSVDIGPDDTIVVGAPFVNSYAGAAYTFAKPSGGFKTTKAYTSLLTAFDGSSGDGLGYSVAVGAHVIVLGAPGHAGFTGSAVTFANPPGRGNNPYYNVRLVDPSGAPGDSFGWKSSAYQYASLIATPFANNTTGQAYLFNQYTAKFTSSDSAAGDAFGNDVSLIGTGPSEPTTIAIGAPFNNNEKGAAYIYLKPTTGEWTTTSKSNAKLTSSDSVAYDGFGFSLSLSGTTLGIGAPGAGKFTGKGYVYLQPGAGWATTATPDSILTATPSIAGGYFGWSTGVAPNGTVLMGASANNTPTDTGSAYVYK